MKLIVAGSTGFVGTEIVRQALSHPAITSVVGLARRPTPTPHNADPGMDTTKLKSVVCEDFMNYTDDVKQELAGADACIWLVSVTITRARSVTQEKAREICLEYTMTGLDTISELSTSKQFRFIYTSGAKSERDPTRAPWLMRDYLLLRGEVETRVLNYAKDSGSDVEACVVKPGLVDGETGRIVRGLQTVGCYMINMPRVEVSDLAAALLQQVVEGFDSDTLLYEDLVRIGQKALAD
ncbi:hypothetical protein VE01_09975 [Pseudogymnoascus verrucosus]|uniref:NAD(P)-binding domain-containing protein n=1 Tax=Pseudogymnoascus verrucosus TaxID=342668 RepID=A0A1B8G8T8_9PEZI|nr:uncharacterized protein VE01_09975 [Pseudogymnoascus verrucosus]OBT92244.1 hypothetical protein VE01_09975 [Pseudogymnoascus verrucosus]